MISTEPVDRDAMRRQMRARALPTILAAAAAAVPLAAFLYVAISRLNYPLDLEWLEGTSIEMARRFAAGLPLYTPPTINHVSVRYFPFYFIVVGTLYKAFGVSYWAGRAVSTMATLATGGLSFLVVRRFTRMTAAGLAAAGIWFAAFGFSGHFYDLNRVDSLAVFLLMAAYAAAFLRPGARGGALAGILLTFSAFTKQNHIAFLVPILFAQILRRDRRGAIACAAACVVSLGVALGSWMWASDGWIWLMTMKFIPFGAVRARTTWFPADFLRSFALAAALIAAYGIRLLIDRRWRDFFADPWLGFWAGSVALCWVFRISVGCYTNVYMLAALATATAVGVMLPALIDAAPDFLRRASAWLVALAAVGMIASAFQPPTGQIPPPEQWRAADRFREFVRAQPGLVYVSDFLLFEPNVLQFHSIFYQDMRKWVGVWKIPWRVRLQNDLDRLRPAVVIPFGRGSRGSEYDRMLAGMEHKTLPVDMRPRTVTGFDAMPVNVYLRPPSSP